MLGIPVLLSWFVYYDKGAGDHTARFFHIQKTPHTLNPHVRNGEIVETASCRFHRDCGPHVRLDAKRQNAASSVPCPYWLYANNLVSYVRI
jgi:hypothetical protein